MLFTTGKKLYKIGKDLDGTTEFQADWPKMMDMGEKMMGLYDFHIGKKGITVDYLDVT